MIKDIIGVNLSAYKANTHKPLAKDDTFFFNRKKCLVLEVFTKGVRYEYCNIGLRNGSSRFGARYMTFDYMFKNGKLTHDTWWVTDPDYVPLYKNRKRQR